MDEEKRRVAIVSMGLLGLGALYLLKDDFPEVIEITKEEKQKERGEKSGEERETTKIPVSEEIHGEKPEFRESAGGENELHGVTWQDLSRIIGDRYPGNDMWYIYSYLSEDVKRKWRRGILYYGVSTLPDRHFVYYDTYYFAMRMNPSLERTFNLYAYGRCGFEELLKAYQETIAKYIR